jgi:ribosomal-protein-serine acetyltransferase
MILKADDNISLELLAEKHAAGTFNLIDVNRIHLKEWLPWVDNMQTVNDFKAYITNCNELHQKGTDLGCVIIYDNAIAGRIGIHHINLQNKIGAIGYWLGESFSGKGIITRSCQAIIKYGFEILNLNRIEIKCGTGNYKSKAIAERLNFTKEGVLRQAELVNGKYIDLYLFSLLKEEWQNKK